MRISKVIERLSDILEREGDIETTCTASTLEDDHGGPIPDVFESTVENFVVGENPKFGGKKVRIYM